MKYKTTFLVAAFAFANAHTVAARQAEIKSFSPVAGDFQLIEPSFEAPPTAKTTGYQPADPEIQLDQEFAALAPDPIPLSKTDVVQTLRIPTWMKGSLRITTPSLPFYATTTPPSSGNCVPVRYAPHPSLNASQELRRQRYFNQMVAAACGAGVPVDLFDALIIQESRYNPLAVSTKGASGLTQLMPATARSLGIFDRWNVSQNLLGGARYLRKQLDTFGNWAHALSAYNAGPGTVIKYGGVPPFRETRGYVRTILSSMDTYQRSRGQGGLRWSIPRRGVTLASFNR
ncbi:lytic transglycosylase domain-containing protein [Novosphingobium sp. AP12]|uniref:lytic transglycosylase domain-containing protein n=1 Tax=Novosphingobium sp. AP12 TaxID=1144305 RepID=UPI000271D970|nr:lytic transglycosylase domain-containing protein [Novosphingobium sp. AP12]EJL20405.1 soluble lytic murein transglycosylase-like protein [Novosphingobium sp. AP12]